MDQTPNLNLPYILPAQAQKHVTHNEAIRALDALVQLAVLDRDLSIPPAGPADGDRYLIAAGASGEWTGQSGTVAAFQDGAWAFLTPRNGWLAWVGDENGLFAFDGTDWIAAGGGGGGVNPAPLVGVNATADTTNRLAVSSPASLFSHDGAGHQQKVNKAAAVDTASVLFQTGFSGRAEMGTTGDDDFHFKVSADGATWKEGIKVDKSTGAVTFPNGGGQIQVDSFTSSGTWTKPVWARRVTVRAIGGGGGGGSGRKGAAGTARVGGGGGAGGSLTESLFVASDLGATESVTIGAGGTGGAAQTADSSDGISGTDGGDSLLGTYLRAKGGPGGAGGSSTAVMGGIGYGAGAFSGSGGGTLSFGNPPSSPSPTVRGGGGGGAGGGFNVGNSNTAGANGAPGGLEYGPGAAAGTKGTVAAPPAGNGGSVSAGKAFGGGGGGGGAGQTGGTPGPGGNGGNYGGGGGGGAGAIDSTNNSGAGGSGANGIVVVISES